VVDRVGRLGGHREGNFFVGNLARFGIVGGAKVAVRDLGCLPVPIHNNDFSDNALRSLGFEPIQRKIEAGARLNAGEIEALIERAPLSVLMKLVEIGRQATPHVEPSPIVTVSLAAGALNDGLDCLRRIEHPSIEVLLEGVELDTLGDGLEEQVKTVAGCRPGLTIVGPAAEDILSWLHAHERRSRVLHDLTLSDVVGRLRGAGMDRLRACRDVAALAALSSTGFRQSFCSALDTLATPRELAEHLQAIDTLSRQDGCLSVWFPGFSRACRTFPHAGAALDLLMLRMLALGTVCLPKVPRRRASSRYLSLEGFAVAHLCGANDFGFGALDDTTEDILQLKKLGALREARPGQKRPRLGPPIMG